jgi:GntR family transcriptional regulator, transcriptional repressor for pyruvate dehydrogenase complex
MNGSTGRSGPLRRPRSADLMVQELVDRISAGGIAPGERIGSEQDMIEDFGVSRSVVREALRLLERDGIVRVKPGPSGGVFATRPGSQPLARSIDLYGAFHDVDMGNLVEARIELEVITAGLAAKRATAEDVAEMERLEAKWIDYSNAVRSREEIAAVNVDFHRAVTRAAHNPVFEAMVDALGGLLFEAALSPEVPDSRVDTYSHSHDEILAAVKSRDSQRAGEAVRTHIETFRPDWRKEMEAAD